MFCLSEHPNVKAFFGHGGLLGLSEAVYTGTPMVLLPMFGDQFHNSYTAKARGVAQVIMFADLNEQSLRQAINDIFNDTRYGCPLGLSRNPEITNSSLLET